MWRDQQVVHRQLDENEEVSFTNDKVKHPLLEIDFS
jgi:hypothetical protein